MNLIFPTQALTIVTSYKNLTLKNQHMYVSLKKSKCYFVSTDVTERLKFLYICIPLCLCTAHVQGSENDLRVSILVLH